MYGAKRQFYAGSVSGLSMMCMGHSMGWASSFLKKTKDGEVPFILTNNQLSWVIAVMDFGSIVSPMPTIYIVDHKGQKMALMACALLFQVSWLLVIFSTEIFLLLFSRFVAGMAKGMAFTIVPIYLAEIAENQIRGAISVLFSFEAFFGTILGYFIGCILHYDFSSYVAIVLPVILFFWLFYIPDSPYYYLLKNDKSDAMRSLYWLRACKIQDPIAKKEYVRDELVEMEREVEKERHMKGTWWELIHTEGMRRATKLVIISSALQRLGGISSIVAYSATTLPTLGYGLEPHQHMVLFGIVVTASFIPHALLIDRIGRKPLLVVSTTLAAIVQGATAVFFYMDYYPEHDVSEYQWVPYVTILLYGFSYSVGIGMGPHTLVGEIYPSTLRCHGAALSAMILSIASFGENIAFSKVKYRFGVHYMYMFFCAINIVATIYTVVFLFETKKKSFGEIQDILHKNISNIRSYQYT